MKISKRYLTRLISEERAKLFEDGVDSELDNLKKNVHDDIEHVKDLKKDIEDDKDEEERAGDYRKDESKRHVNRSRKVGYSALRRIIREERALSESALKRRIRRKIKEATSSNRSRHIRPRR